jgi:hypothetical protein
METPDPPLEAEPIRMRRRPFDPVRPNTTFFLGSFFTLPYLRPSVTAVIQPNASWAKQNRRSRW